MSFPEIGSKAVRTKSNCRIKSNQCMVVVSCMRIATEKGVVHSGYPND